MRSSHPGRDHRGEGRFSLLQNLHFRLSSDTSLHHLKAQGIHPVCPLAAFAASPWVIAAPTKTSLKIGEEIAHSGTEAIHVHEKGIVALLRGK